MVMTRLKPLTLEDSLNSKILGSKREIAEEKRLCRKQKKQENKTSQ
jgi:hypothetical protein